MSVDQDKVEGFELTFSVQIDDNRILELLVDQVFAGDCFWQVTDAGSQVLDRSQVYKDQAHCLRDGLNKADHETRLREEIGTIVHRAGGLDLWCDKLLTGAQDPAAKS
ncbi:hypothetical protein [Pseudomonas savastanoi]|uniref:hypothetical protein n=1 Tax=Pseudomonas savastanoi TaxID=29438 RepID=UPI001585BA3F|nr:hypothetical protein [Pseudomonas savastanoi]